MTVSSLTPGQTYYFSAKFYNGPASKSPTAVERDPDIAGKDFGVSVYPNPGNPTTYVRFYLPFRQAVQVTVFDMAGEKVKTLWLGGLAVGTHRIEWTGKTDAGKFAASGVYFVKIRGEKRTFTKRLVLLK
jgi:flagellar hook assembly protein FlgD